MTKLFESVTQNAMFLVEFFLIIAALFLFAFMLEKLNQKRNGVSEKIFTTKKTAMIGMFSALATILMLLEFPVILIAPNFYKLDFSEVPILVGTFAFGPAAGVMMEFIKVLLKCLVKGTSTAFVGDLANFCVGCSFIIPASLIYDFKKTKKNAIIGCIVGTVIITIFGTAFNAVYLLPAFAKMFHMPLEAILQMGAEINPMVKSDSVVSFVVVCVAPLNIIKGTAASVVTMLIYKPLSPILKASIGKKDNAKKNTNQADK